MPSPAVSPTLPPSVSPSGPPRRIAVIGGGISGLAAAHRLIELDPTAQVTLFEASARLGGVLQTELHDGWLIERSADMFTTREPWALELCRRIGLADELIETDAQFRKAYVVRRNKLVPVPEGFTLMSPAKIWPIVTTSLLSPLGKVRLAWEYFTPTRKDNADESLESFVVRRFGREAFDRLIQPLIGGIYTADPAKLSLAATLPQFLEMERKHGSLIRGMRAKGTGDRVQGTGARYGLFLAPRDGMQRLVEAVAARLPPSSIRLNTVVERIDRANDQWRLTVGVETESFDEIILAAPGAVSSRLLASVDAELAALLGKIEYAGCSVAVLGVRRQQIAWLPPCFGFVVPAIENRKIIAGSFASVKFPGRAPEGKLLIRVFIGGALQPALGRLPDDEIRRIVLQELSELIGLSGEPEFCDVVRWQEHMPQYHVGHLDLVRQIEERAAELPHFALAGNAYRGVGVPFCVRSGEQAAERVIAANCPSR
jgi:protoporphyrinogen/coproporphyrinogen III oxidase